MVEEKEGYKIRNKLLSGGHDVIRLQKQQNTFPLSEEQSRQSWQFIPKFPDGSKSGESL